MKNIEIYESLNILNKIIDFELPLYLSNKIKKAIQIISVEYNNLEKIRMEIINKLGEEKDDKNKYITENNKEEFDNEWKAILNQEIKKETKLALENIGKIDLNFNNNVITTRELLKIDWIIK